MGTTESLHSSTHCLSPGAAPSASPRAQGSVSCGAARTRSLSGVLACSFLHLLLASLQSRAVQGRAQFRADKQHLPTRGGNSLWPQQPKRKARIHPRNPGTEFGLSPENGGAPLIQQGDPILSCLSRALLAPGTPASGGSLSR